MQNLKYTMLYPSSEIFVESKHKPADFEDIQNHIIANELGVDRDWKFWITDEDGSERLFDHVTNTSTTELE